MTAVLPQNIACLAVSYECFNPSKEMTAVLPTCRGGSAMNIILFQPLKGGF